MASRRITKKLKAEIQATIEAHVKGKMNVSLPGKELAEATRNVEKGLRAACVVWYPEEDMKVLKKYKEICHFDSLQFSVDKDKRLYTPWRGIKRNTWKIEFTPPLVVPFRVNAHEITKHLNTKEPGMPALKAQILFAMRTYYHVECEIQETVKAYMERISLFTTTAKLLAKHPEYEKFIPEEGPTPAQREAGRTRSIIESFEAA
jgi:hypothetical protein